MNQILYEAFLKFLKNTSDMVFIKDKNLVYQAASPSFARMVGKERAEEIVGHTDFEIFESAELARRYTDDDQKLLAGGKDLINYIEPLTDDHGHPRYSSTSKYILSDENGTMIGILGISRDITKEYMTRQRYQKELKYLFELPQDTYAALFMDIDEWRIIRHQSHDVQGHTVVVQETMETFIDNAIKRLADPVDATTREFFQNLSRESMLKICESGVRNQTMEYRRYMSETEVSWVRTDIHFLIDPESGHLCAIWSLRNINSEKQKTMNLLHAAAHDQMTGILNKAHTEKRIQQILEDENNTIHALFAIDVDNFKSLNDTLGHQIGDQFLVTLAKTLKNCFRESDVVGRVGGDEFFVLMKNIYSAFPVAEKAETLLRISKMLCQNYQELDLSLSIGISMYPVDGQNLDALYAKADEALYQAKKQGKNQVVFATDIVAGKTKT